MQNFRAKKQNRHKKREIYLTKGFTVASERAWICKLRSGAVQTDINVAKPTFFESKMQKNRRHIREYAGSFAKACFVR